MGVRQIFQTITCLSRHTSTVSIERLCPWYSRLIRAIFRSPTLEVDLCQNDYGTLPPIVDNIPPGIMGVSSVLLAAEPISFLRQDYTVETTYDLTQLMSTLHINSDDRHQLNELGENLISQSHIRHRQLLDAADMLFLGGSHAHAYHTYRDVYRLQLTAQASFEEEQLFVQGIIGCLKSAATDEQREESIEIAQQFLNQLDSLGESNPKSTSESTSEPPCLRSAFDTWDSSDCATSKAVFDLLTSYKKHRRWTTTAESAWAHRMTVHEWMCMRLVRLPLWHDMVNFNPTASSMAGFSSQPNAIFDIDNLKTILQWTTTALAETGSWYDEQASLLQQAASTSAASSASSLSTSNFQALLFWRLAFFSKHNNSPNNNNNNNCPELRVRLSSDTAFIAHPLQTTSIIAHVLLDDNTDRNNSPKQISSTVHIQMLEHMQSALEEPLHSDECQWVFSSFWSGLKAKLAPSFVQRCNNNALLSS